MRHLLLLSLLFMVACRFPAVEPLPLAGGAPATIAVWPVVVGGLPGGRTAMLEGLGNSVARRGYGVVAPAVALQLLRDAGAPPPHATGPADLALTGRLLDADAVLVLEVREFSDESDDARGRYLAARWDLGWRLLSTRGGGELWSYAHRGSWRRPVADTDDPFRRPDDTMRPVLLSGEREWRFRDRRELLANLHDLALQRLPDR